MAIYFLLAFWLALELLHLKKMIDVIMRKSILIDEYKYVDRFVYILSDII